MSRARVDAEVIGLNRLFKMVLELMRAIARPSIQSLLIEMRVSGHPLATGTAFVVSGPSGPLLLTNRHNVTGINPHTGVILSKTGGVPNELSIIHNAAGKLGQWVQKVEPLYVVGFHRWKEHPVLKEKGDFVALPLTQLDGVDLHPHELSGSHDIQVGPAEPVSVIGFPFGLTAGGAFGVWATGFVASEPVVDFDGLPIVLIDCRTRPGQSGSPVIAYRSGGMISLSDGGSAVFNGPVSKLIGIYSGRINAESDLGIVWKASALEQLVQSV